MATPAEIVSRIDEKVYTILADPDSIASYRLGNKSVSRSQVLDQLRQLRETYQAIAEKTPAEDIRQVAFDLDDWGVEESEVVGDSLT